MRNLFFFVCICVIVGAVMMLLIFVYSLRKRSSLLQKIGTQSQWLNVHIFFGFAGPVRDHEYSHVV